MPVIELDAAQAPVADVIKDQYGAEVPTDDLVLRPRASDLAEDQRDEVMAARWYEVRLTNYVAVPRADLVLADDYALYPLSDFIPNVEKVRYRRIVRENHRWSADRGFYHL